MKNKLIYFDNAATSNFKPKSVTKNVIRSLKKSANPGRSGHKLSLNNSMEIWKTREIIAAHFGNIEPENVIFTKNCTEALNIAILGTVKKNGNVICSCFEHNSVLRPLHELENKGIITLTIVSPKNKKYVTSADIKEKIIPSTYLICVNSLSNVTGNKNEIPEIGKICKEKNILFLVDNAQGCGHLKIDMIKSHINFLSFAGHKGFFAPQSIGGLCINSKIIPNPIIFGGTGTESENMLQPSTLPERLESGTLSTPLIIGLNKGIEFVDKKFNKLNNKTRFLTEYLYENLKKIKGITIYSLPNLESGIVSFNYKNYDSVEITEYLDKNFNIATRGGLHCAPLTHNFLNTTKSGIVRISLNFKNTKKEINTLIKAIQNFKK